MGAREVAPQRGSPAHAGAEVAAAQEGAAAAREDWVEFIVTRRWCVHDLMKFGATGWLFAMLAGGEVVAVVQDAKQRFEKLERKLGCVGVFLDGYHAL